MLFRPTLVPRVTVVVALLAGGLLSGCLFEREQPTLSDEEQIDLYYENALRYYDMGELDRAQDQVDRGLEVEEEEPRLLLLMGWIRQRKGTTNDVLAAEEIFRKLLEGEDYRARLGLAQALERKGVLYDQGARQIASGDRFTDAPDPEVQAAELRSTAMSIWTESIEYYEQTLALQPDDREALNGMQRVYALLGEDDESLHASEELLAVLKENVDFWRVQMEREDLTANSESRLRGLLNQNTELEIKTHMHVASVLRRLDRDHDAVAHLDRVIEIDPDLPEAYSRRGQLLYELGLYQRAIDSIDDYLRLSTLDFEHPSIRRAYELRTDCETALGVESQG